MTQEVHCYTDDVLVTDNNFLAHNVEFTIFHQRFLKESALVIHRGHVHKKYPALQKFYWKCY